MRRTEGTFDMWAFDTDRRHVLAKGGAAGLTLAVAACGGGTGIDPLPSGRQQASAQQASEGGNVKVGMILPLSAPGGIGAAATAIRNAGDLALSEFDRPDISLLVKDDRGDPAAAREAVQQALAEGAELILGPFSGTAVQAASPLVKTAGRPMIAFSSDVSVAQPGIYLLSFTPQSDVARIMSFAASRNKRTIGALLPEGPFGNVIAAEYEQQVARLGLNPGPVQRYAAGRQSDAVRALAPQLNGVDALFVTDVSNEMARTADAIGAASLKNVQLLGTGTWNDLPVLQKPALQGAWFSAPDAAGYNSFAQRYQQKFKANPTRMATIGYDAVALAAALVRTQGANRFSPQTLTNPSGFAGQDGVFRFRPDGTNERALAVMQVQNRAAQVLNPAPRSFGAQQA
jgi:ABC-type branched-subunit amino acid transport system substrate-binding protein